MASDDGKLDEVVKTRTAMNKVQLRDPVLAIPPMLPALLATGSCNLDVAAVKLAVVAVVVVLAMTTFGRS